MQKGHVINSALAEKPFEAHLWLATSPVIQYIYATSCAYSVMVS